MFRVIMGDFSVEVDEETAADFHKDPEYARRFLERRKQELANSVPTLDNVPEVEEDSTLDGEVLSQGESSRTFRWSHRAILLLLDHFKMNENKFELGQCKQAWKLISSSLTERGIKVSPQQCSSKMDTLKRRYKSIKDNNNRTGAAPITWEYYSVMSELFHKKTWAEPLQGAVSSTAPCLTAIENLPDAPRLGRLTSYKSPRKRKNMDEILNDFKMERLKRDEAKRIRLEEKNKRREEAEKKREQRHKEKMALKRELLEILRNSHQGNTST